MKVYTVSRANLLPWTFLEQLRYLRSTELPRLPIQSFQSHYCRRPEKTSLLETSITESQGQV